MLTSDKKNVDGNPGYGFLLEQSVTSSELFALLTLERIENRMNAITSDLT